MVFLKECKSNGSPSLRIFSDREQTMKWVGGYDKWVKSKSKCAPTLGVFTGPLQAIWYPNWALCMKKTP